MPRTRLLPPLGPLLGALALLAPGAAPAQDVGTGILDGLQRQQFQSLDARIGADSVGETARRQRGRVSEAGPGALPFASTPDLRARTVARRVQELRATNPVAAAEVAREMSRHDYDAIFRAMLDGTGLRADDAGDVLAAFTAMQWMVANDATAEPSPAALQAIRQRFVAPMAGRPPLSEPGSRAAFAEQVKLRAVLHHAAWQAARRLGTVRAYVSGLSAEYIPPASLRALALTDEGLVPRGSGGRAAARPADRERPRADPPVAPVAEAPPAPRPDDAPPRHAENWAGVEGVYFRSTSGVGAGGMVVLEFEPLILFRDGGYYEIDDAALEDVDLDAERRAKPRRFGRWTRSGERFVLTGSGGKPQDYALQGGSFFKAFPAGAGETVARSYRRIGGGGNAAMGGDVMIAVSNRYDFRADGSYGRGGSVGATNSGATTGVSSALARRRAPEGGRYALDRHTLTLTGADGRVQRRFFAFGSQGDPARIDREMAFIGDRVFTNPD